MWLDTEKCDFKILDILKISRKQYTRAPAKRDFTVVSCRLSGTTVFTSGQQEIRADAHNYILIPSDVEYSQISSNEEVICVHLELNGLNIKELQGVYSPSPELRQSFISLYRLWMSKENGYLLKCKSLVYDILFEFNGLIEANSLRNSQIMLSPALEYIYKRCCDKDFSITAAIDAAHLSPAYFRRIFKTVYGTTPNVFVNRLKIERAKVLIAEGLNTVSEISETCGFLNDKYFFSVFKKITGSTPSEWRKTHG